MVFYWCICRPKKMCSDKKHFNRLNSKINNKLRLTMSQRFLPFLLGLLWVSNYQIVFFCGAAISCMRLIVAFTIKSEPLKGQTIKSSERRLANY